MANSLIRAKFWVNFICSNCEYPDPEKLRAQFENSELSEFCNCGCNSFKVSIRPGVLVDPIASKGKSGIYISGHRDWSNAQLDSLRAANIDDFCDLFKQDHGERLSQVVSCCLEFSGWPDHKLIGDNARAALVRIGKENELNSIRVRRFGIKDAELLDDAHC